MIQKSPGVNTIEYRKKQKERSKRAFEVCALKAYLHDTTCRIQFLLWRMETRADVRFLLVR